MDVSIHGSNAVAEFRSVQTRDDIQVKEGVVIIGSHGRKPTHFAWPPLDSLTEPPDKTTILVLEERELVIEGSTELLGASDLRLWVQYYDDVRKVGRDSLPLQEGQFSFRSRPPQGATEAVLIFRTEGVCCFRVHSIAISDEPLEDCGELPSPNVHQPFPNRGSVAMFVFNEIGHDSRVLKTAGGLSKAGYDVTLFGVWRDGTESVQKKQFADLSAYIFPNGRSFLKGVRDEGLKHHYTVAYVTASMWSYVEALKPDFIHTHDYHTVILGLEYAKRLRSQGNVVYWLHDIHDYVRGYIHLNPFRKEAILEQEMRAIQHMDYRFTVSPLIAKWATEQYKLSAPPTIVLNAPLDPAALRPSPRSIRRDVGLPEGVPLIVYSGVLFEMKGVRTLVEAIAARKDWHLAIVSNPNDFFSAGYLEQLKSIAETGGYSNRLHIVPYVKPHEVPSYLSSASVGVIPFHHYGNAHASLPNKLYDYVHARLPVVVSDCELMKEFIEDWGCGEVFEAENAHSCAKAVSRILSDPDAYRERIESRPDLLNRYTWEEQCNLILKAYQGFEVQKPRTGKAAS